MSETEQPLSPKQRRARREAQVIETRETVARSRALLEEGRKVRAQLRITKDQIATYVAERRAVRNELSALNGKKRKKSKRVRTPV